MVTRVAFTALVVALAVQRLAETVRSRRHEAELRAAGAREVGAGHFPAMVALHTAWLIGMPLEVWLLERPLIPALAIGAGLVAIVGQWLRLAAMHALGPRWTVRVLVLPDTPPVDSGLYGRLRHPNYVGVALEIAAIPLIHGAWICAAVGSVLNTALLLGWRIPTEDRALRGPHPPLTPGETA